MEASSNAMASQDPELESNLATQLSRPASLEAVAQVPSQVDANQESKETGQSIRLSIRPENQPPERTVFKSWCTEIIAWTVAAAFNLLILILLLIFKNKQQAK